MNVSDGRACPPSKSGWAGKRTPVPGLCVGTFWHLRCTHSRHVETGWLLRDRQGARFRIAWRRPNLRAAHHAHLGALDTSECDHGSDCRDRGLHPVDRIGSWGVSYRAGDDLLCDGPKHHILRAASAALLGASVAEDSESEAGVISRPFGVGPALPEGSPAVAALVADVTNVPKASISGEFRGVPRFLERLDTYAA